MGKPPGRSGWAEWLVYILFFYATKLQLQLLTQSPVFSCEKQLYKRLRPSVRPSFRGSRVSRKPRIQQNSTKFPTFRNWWPLWVQKLQTNKIYEWNGMEYELSGHMLKCLSTLCPDSPNVPIPPMPRSTLAHSTPFIAFGTIILTQLFHDCPH